MLMSSWIASLALVFLPVAEESWLDHVPTSADVVVRTKGLEATRGELVAMLKAMSPSLGDQAGPALEQHLGQFKQLHGEQAATQPFVMLLRVVPLEDPAKPPFAIVVQADNYEGVLKSVAGGAELKLTKEEGGFDSFPIADGQVWYAARSAGHIAFGPDKLLVSSMTKEGGATYGKSASANVKAHFGRGDLAVLVNSAALTARYQEQIAQAKQSFFAIMEQAGQQVGNAGMMDMVKKMYGTMFDSAKDADMFVLSLDFEAEGLGLDGILTVKEGTGAAKFAAAAKNDEAAELGKLPAGDAYYVYVDLDAKAFRDLQKMGLSMLSSQGKPSPELEAVLAKLQTGGRIQMFGSTSLSQGMKTLNVIRGSDPKGLLAMTEQSYKAMKSSEIGPLNFIKDVQITPDAGTYEGYTFTRYDLKLDFDKLGQLQAGNPAGVQSFKNLYGGDTITNWSGVNDSEMIQLIQPSWEKVKETLDAYKKGEKTIGATKGFQAVRVKLPKEVSAAVMVSAQGMLGQLATQFGMKLPADLPSEPAILGGALTMAAPNGFEFQLVVPSSVGPVFQKGFGPIIQGLQGGAKP